MKYKIITIIIIIMILPTNSNGNMEIFSEQYVIEGEHEWVDLYVPGELQWLNLTAALSNTTDRVDPAYMDKYERIYLRLGRIECNLGRESPQDYVTASCVMQRYHTGGSGQIIYEQYPSYYTHYFPLQLPFNRNTTISLRLNGTHGFYYVNNYYMNLTKINHDYVHQKTDARISVSMDHVNASNIWVLDYSYIPYQITETKTEHYIMNSTETITETKINTTTQFVIPPAETITEYGGITGSNLENSAASLPIPIYLSIIALPILLLTRRLASKTLK